MARTMLLVAIVVTVIAPAASYARGGGGGHASGSGHSSGHGSSHGKYATTSSHRSGRVSGHYSVGGVGNTHVVAAHYTKNGEYVQSYHATNPNRTTGDNFSTIGNVNPYTGAAGTKPNVRP
jgi:hypothetical protein